MRSCREITALVSKALDTTLNLHERFAVRLHLILCSRCRNFQKQTDFLRKVAHRYAEHLENQLNNKP